MGVLCHTESCCFGFIFSLHFPVLVFIGKARYDPYTLYILQEASENRGSGWCAPECINGATYTLKSDVYSFGVVMLEILTGRMPFDRLAFIVI